MTNVWAALAMIAMVCIVVTVMLDSHERRTKLQRLVFDNLDSAAANGYFASGEHCHDMTTDELAYDLTCYAPDLEGVSSVALVPYVEQWKLTRGVI